MKKNVKLLALRQKSDFKKNVKMIYYIKYGKMHELPVPLKHWRREEG